MRQIFFFNPDQISRNSLKIIILQRIIMKLTNKGRYAVMAMADLASNLVVVQLVSQKYRLDKIFL